jgi:cytochrome c556
MKASTTIAAWLGVGLSAAFTVSVVAQSERKLSINAVMHKQYTVSKAPFVLIKKELAGEHPDWKKVRDASRSFATLARALEKNEPPWGEKASWKTFTDDHLGSAKALEDAAQARDKDAVMAVHRKLAASCKACHAAHRYRGRE